MLDLKSRRLELGLTLEEVGEMVGVGKSTVRKWENGMIDNMRRDKISLLAKALKISPLQLLGDEYSREQPNDINYYYNRLEEPRKEIVLDFTKEQYNEQINDTQSIYLVGQTAAGSGVAYSQLNAEQINTNVPAGADYALTVRGNSMEPLIHDGQIIFYKQQPVVENGEIAIVELNGSEVTCKRFYAEDGIVILKSINEDYEDMVITDSIRVIGKVIL